MSDSRLYTAAVDYAKHPGDLDRMAEFHSELNRERSVENLIQVLPFDYERVSGQALMRIAEVITAPDADLLLAIAYWNYHFGMDSEAIKYLEKARQLTPDSIAVAKAEVYFSFTSDLQRVLELCNDGLKNFPNDPWFSGIKEEILRTGRLSNMRGPQPMPHWHELCHK